MRSNFEQHRPSTDARSGVAQPKPRPKQVISHVTALAMSAGLLSLGVAAPALAQWGQDHVITGTVTSRKPAPPEITAVVPIDSRVQNHSFQTTEVVTVRDTGGTATTAEGAQITLTVQPLSGNGLQQHMSVSVWPVRAGEACTGSSDPQNDAATGLWAEGVVSPPTPVVSGGQVQFCVRGFPTLSTPITDRFSPEQNRPATVAALGTPKTGTQAFSEAARYSAQLSVGAAVSESQALSSKSSISTELIYPIQRRGENYTTVWPYNFSREHCLGAYPSAVYPEDPAGSARVYVGACIPAPSSNLEYYRRWHEFQWISQTDSPAVRIRVNNPVPETGFVTGTGINGSVVTLPGVETDTRQLWIPQEVEGFGTQLVNQYTGQCFLNPVKTSSGKTVTNDCNTNTNMGFSRSLTVWR